MSDAGKQRFLHDADASSDPKLVRLRKRFGWQGVGIYWLLIERLRGAYKDFRMPEEDVEDLEYQFQIEPGLAKSILEFVSDPENYPKADSLLIERRNGFYSSPSLDRRMTRFEEARHRRSKAGKVGAEARWGKPDDPDHGDSDAEAMRSHSDRNATPLRSECDEMASSENKNKTKTKTKLKQKEKEKRSRKELKGIAMAAGIPVGQRGEESLTLLVDSIGAERVVDCIERSKLYWLPSRGKIKTRKYRLEKRWGNFVERISIFLSDESLVERIRQEMIWESRASEIPAELERIGIEDSNKESGSQRAQVSGSTDSPEDRIEHLEGLIAYKESEIQRLTNLGINFDEVSQTPKDRRNAALLIAAQREVAAAKEEIDQIRDRLVLEKNKDLLDGPAETKSEE